MAGILAQYGVITGIVRLTMEEVFKTMSMRERKFIKGDVTPSMKNFCKWEETVSYTIKEPLLLLDSYRF